VQRALIFFGFVSLFAGCGHAAPLPAPRAPAPFASAAPPKRVEPTGCRAEPSTVYGDEAVAFTIDAPSPTRVSGELLDERGQRVAQDALPAPGSWRPEPLPSGDFTLKLGGGAVLCSVTVNRELLRATQPKR